MNFSAFNLNTLQTVLTMAALAGIGFLKASGCVETGAPGTALECSQSFLAQWISPGTLAWVAGLFLALKLTVIPWFQPGGWLYNLFAPKVPVTNKPNEPGTVTPIDVAK